MIASMIERETVAPEERRLVSAVIYNRLERDMALAASAGTL
jgi:cell division protein YceG involved in septum cleavage